MRVLAIESSCDESAAAVLDARAGLLAHQLFSQVELHRAYGGVVPELASRDHVRRLLPLVRAALERAGTRPSDLQGVAYTAGPGLIGALLLGLPYPGGPQLAQLAERGAPGAFSFPRPMLDRAGLEFSFSGLKTAVLHAVRGRVLTETQRADVARGVQEAIVETLTAKALRALEYTGLTVLVVSGGVSANRALRERLTAA